MFSNQKEIKLESNNIYVYAFKVHEIIERQQV